MTTPVDGGTLSGLLEEDSDLMQALLKHVSSKVGSDLRSKSELEQALARAEVRVSELERIVEKECLLRKAAEARKNYVEMLIRQNSKELPSLMSIIESDETMEKNYQIYSETTRSTLKSSHARIVQMNKAHLAASRKIASLEEKIKRMGLALKRMKHEEGCSGDPCNCILRDCF